MELSKDVIKKLKSIERRQKRISKEIAELGFEVFLSPGGLHIMNGPHHSGPNSNAQYDNIVLTIFVGAWDGGGW